MIHGSQHIGFYQSDLVVVLVYFAVISTMINYLIRLVAICICSSMCVRLSSLSVF